MSRKPRDGWHIDPLEIWRYDAHAEYSAIVKSATVDGHAGYAWTVYRRTPYTLVSKGTHKQRAAAMIAAERILKK